MTIFDEYADYYDALYDDKDYAAEAEYVDRLLHRRGARPGSLLELGCGTGAHAEELAKRGWSMQGIDRSEQMVRRAQARLARSGTSGIGCQAADLREFRSEQRFDAVISLFHVISYQVENRDLEAAFATARHHLEPGGVFLFDCWYGPAVLTVRPGVTVKRCETAEHTLTRVAEPTLLPNQNRVEVEYSLLAVHRTSGRSTEVRERHSMRYLFVPEVESLLGRAGFREPASEVWLTGAAPDTGSWSVTFSAIAG